MVAWSHDKARMRRSQNGLPNSRSSRNGYAKSSDCGVNEKDSGVNKSGSSRGSPGSRASLKSWKMNMSGCNSGSWASRKGW